MDKKKIVTISVCVVIALTVIGVAIYFITRHTIELANENKLSKMYNKMMQDETYSITFTQNDENKYTVSRKGNMANVDMYNDGNHTAHVIKDGNTSLLMYSTKTYYTYQNNEIELTELPNELNEIIQSQEPEKGKEEIDGKTYNYEEYKGISYFLMNVDEEISEDNTSTRFYFKGDELKYIKTIMGEKSEQIQVDVSYNIDNSLFEIPADFQEG